MGIDWIIDISCDKFRIETQESEVAIDRILRRFCLKSIRDTVVGDHLIGQIFAIQTQSEDLFEKGGVAAFVGPAERQQHSQAAVVAVLDAVAERVAFAVLAANRVHF